MKLYLFRTVPLSIIRSLFTVRSAMVYVIKFCSKAVYKPVWHTRIPLLSVQWINSWWWTEELSETFRVSCQNIFAKLLHLVGFITKKFVTMHGHTNVKYDIDLLASQEKLLHLWNESLSYIICRLRDNVTLQYCIFSNNKNGLWFFGFIRTLCWR